MLIKVNNFAILAFYMYFNILRTEIRIREQNIHAKTCVNLSNEEKNIHILYITYIHIFSTKYATVIPVGICKQTINIYTDTIEQ